MPNITTVRKKLIHKMVGLDGIIPPVELFEIIGVEREVIIYDGEKDNNFKIILGGAESYFLHSTSIEDFLKGEDTSAHLKSNYKGGTIQLVL